MKARLPFTAKRTDEGRRQYMVWLTILSVCYTLNEHFGFGKDRLKKLLVLNGEDLKAIAEIAHGYAENRTWHDEIWHWGETMGLNDAVK